jgi:hypothetical protein
MTERKMDRQQQAVAIRDHAVLLLRARGALVRDTAGSLMLWEPPGWILTMRTPFSGWDDGRNTPAPSFAHAAAHQAAMQARPVLPYSLDIWRAGLGKVLSVEWDDARLNVISFKRGPWEAELLALAEQ